MATVPDLIFGIMATVLFRRNGEHGVFISINRPTQKPNSAGKSDWAPSLVTLLKDIERLLEEVG